MAAGILPKPGAKGGPCPMRCRHRDCAQTRQDAQTPCRFCGAPIDYDAPFYRSPLSGDLAHAVCLETAAERRDARVGLFG